ncbi:hypothetical protein B0H17DRAFT_1135042 [Mycena rosella]|uniref:Uncharacterized protein n=1 Tax=Mycena rosella TaxID=1033263 RepID=A0AAD7DEL5_MYCRO|nr:hypothetical protein B0H17DRAFT_1135042 [Mycena rosella]
MVRRLFLPVACIFAQVRRCFATISNRTIDDTKGDAITGFLPIYAPTQQWNVGTDCSGCLVQPDPSQLFDYTWHDTTQGDGGVPSSVTLNFTGTAIYLFCVVPNTITFATTLVNLNFTLDGVPIGTFTHVPDSSSDILYSVPVLSSQNLKNEPHILVAETAGNSLFVFDVAMYTFDDSPPDADTTTTSAGVPTTQTTSLLLPTGPAQSNVTPSHLPVAAIAAGTISGIAAVALVLVLFLCLRRRRRRAARNVERGPIDILTGQVLRPASPVSTIRPIEPDSEPVLPPYARDDPYNMSPVDSLATSSYYRTVPTTPRTKNILTLA